MSSSVQAEERNNERNTEKTKSEREVGGRKRMRMK